MNEPTSFGRAALKPGSQHPPHRRHRHKRFRVRPEAKGVNYETVPPWKSPFSSTFTRPVGLQPVTAIDDFMERPSPAAVVAESTEAKPLSEREIARAAAIKGLKICVPLLVCVVALGFGRAHFGTLKEFGSWVLGSLPQPVKYHHPDLAP